MNQEFNIREAIGSDLAFIFDTFLKSYKMNSAIGRNTANGIFFNNYRFILDRILEESKVFVACKSDEPEIIFGYIIVDWDVLHYVFVKEAFRKLGIAKALYHYASKNYKFTTHRTQMSDQIESFSVPYNPFLLYAAITDEGN